MFSGHAGGLKHALFMNDAKQMVSCAEDKTLRVWDKASGQVNTNSLVYILPLCLHFLEVSSRSSFLLFTRASCTRRSPLEIILSFWLGNKRQRML